MKRRISFIYRAIAKLFGFALLIHGLVAQADSLCFSLAKTYYEQLYCEAKYRGYGQSLPSLYDFQRNDDLTQALLLKASARQMGIVLVMPKVSQNALPARSVTALDKTVSTDCFLRGASMMCGKQRFQFQSNRPNRQLDEWVLSERNRMNMPDFSGSASQSSAVDEYIVLAYTHYLDKMVDIGLAEATMTYGIFSYLFSDLNNKGVSFGKRFEKMYFYLKQDKLNMAVNISSEPSAVLRLEDCYHLNHYWICENSRKNYLYRFVN